MKKSFFISLLIIFAFALCSCSNFRAITQKAKDDKNSHSVSLESPPDSCSFSFDSYQDVEKALTKKGTNEYRRIRKGQNDYGKIYKNTLAAFASEDIMIAVPQMNGLPIPFQNKEGFSNITLFTSELYNLPWFWYHCIVDNQNLDIKISYLDVVANLDMEQTTSYADILQIIAPNAPSPENYEKYESYKAIYEKDIIRQDGTRITAMVSELKDSPKEYVMFYYDGLLISLYGNNELFTDNFWKAFDIAYMF